MISRSWFQQRLKADFLKFEHEKVRISNASGFQMVVFQIPTVVFSGMDFAITAGIGFDMCSVNECKKATSLCKWEIKLSLTKQANFYTLSRRWRFGRCCLHRGHPGQLPRFSLWVSLVWWQKSDNSAKISSQKGQFKKPSFSTSVCWTKQKKKKVVEKNCWVKSSNQDHALSALDPICMKSMTIKRKKERKKERKRGGREGAL